MRMQFDPAKTAVVITAWPDNCVAPELLAWLTATVGIPWSQIRWHNHPQADRDVCAAYHTAVSLALASNAEHLLFADRDIRPHAINTRPWLTTPGSVVGAIYDVEGGHAWDDPGAIHTGLLRIDRHSLESLPRPLFQWIYNDDYTRIVGCPCVHLRRKLNAAGIPTRHAGWVGHTPRHRHTPEPAA